MLPLATPRSTALSPQGALPAALRFPAAMKLKELEGHLQQITTFQDPDYRLEQCAPPSTMSRAAAISRERRAADRRVLAAMPGPQVPDYAAHRCEDALHHRQRVR